MATPTDKQILADANKRLNKKYTTIDNYLTDNGRLKKDGESYKNRLKVVENTRCSDTRTAFISSDKWDSYITEKFGWLVNIYESNPEVAEIIRNGYIKDIPTDTISTSVRNSKWGLGLQVGEYDYLKGTTTKDRSYLDLISTKEKNIKSIAKTVGFDLTDAQASGLAASALKGGWDDNTITDEVKKNITTRASTGTPTSVDTGAPSAPGEKAPTVLQTGNTAAGVRDLAKKYGITLTPAQVEGYLQAQMRGEMSNEQITASFRQQAKSLYPSLSKQLDSGTLDDSVSSYRSIAAQTLGVDDSSIDFTADKFKPLLTFHDPKSNEPRLMNSTEWSGYLRNLPEWKQTKEAQSGYDSIIKNIETMFGKVR